MSPRTAKRGILTVTVLSIGLILWAWSFAAHFGG
jgi:hypothetical protein